MYLHVSLSRTALHDDRLVALSSPEKVRYVFCCNNSPILADVANSSSSSCLVLVDMGFNPAKYDVKNETWPNNSSEH